MFARYRDQRQKGCKSRQAQIDVSLLAVFIWPPKASYGSLFGDTGAGKRIRLPVVSMEYISLRYLRLVLYTHKILIRRLEGHLTG